MRVRFMVAWRHAQDGAGCVGVNVVADTLANAEMSLHREWARLYPGRQILCATPYVLPAGLGFPEVEG